MGLSKEKEEWLKAVGGIEQPREPGTEYVELTNKIENLNKEIRYIENFIRLHEFAITILALWLVLK